MSLRPNGLRCLRCNDTIFVDSRKPKQECGCKALCLEQIMRLSNINNIVKITGDWEVVYSEPIYIEEK